MLAGDSLELRLASECWLRFSPKQNELATTFAVSSPGEFIDNLLELFAWRSPSEPVLRHSPRLASRLMNACLLWFLCQLSCVFNFNYFMPSFCTITHKSKAPSLFINVMHFIKNQGDFDNFSREIEWKMPTYDSSNKHFWASNNSPQLDSCLSSSKVCLLKDKRICFKKRFLRSWINGSNTSEISKYKFPTVWIK